MKQSKLLFLLIAALAFDSCRPTAQQTVADAEQPTDSTEAVTSADTLRLVSRSGEIDTTTGKMTFDSEAWYTLDGVRLSGKPSTKGIYINNGKKVAIK